MVSIKKEIDHPLEIILLILLIIIIPAKYFGY